MSEELIKRLRDEADILSAHGYEWAPEAMREAADALSRPAPVQVPEGNAVYQLECKMRGYTYWIDCDQKAYETEKEAGGPCRVLYAAPSAPSAPAAPSVDAEKVSGWQPIETAPKDGRQILAFRPAAPAYGDEQIVICRTTAAKNFAWDGGDNYTDRANTATHWQPLPPPPAIANQEGE